MGRFDEGGKVITYKNKQYYMTETDEQVTLKTVNKNRYGLYSTLIFTKDEDLHRKSLESIKEFFLREII
jgi:hypothetical protein